MERLSASAHIWLIGGTSESAQLAAALSVQSIPYVVTVTTESAKRLYTRMTPVWVGKLTPESMLAFLDSWGVRGILDASHPFAIAISHQAIAAASAQSLPYLRYERAACPNEILDESSEESSNESSDNCSNDILRPSIISVDSIDSLLSSDILSRQRVLFTIGYRHLSKFSYLRPKSQLFARVLPSPEALSGARAAGFSPSEIVALRPPVSEALEAALWQQWQITRVVAKASGQPGGEAAKRQVAASLGISLVLIQRPAVSYPSQTNAISRAVEFCLKTLSVY